MQISYYFRTALVLLFALIICSPLSAKNDPASYNLAFWQALELTIGADPSATLAQSKELIAQFEQQGHKTLQAKAIVVAIRCLTYLEQYAEIITYSESGLVLARALNNKNLESIFLISLGFAKAYKQEYVKSNNLINLGLALARSELNKLNEGEALMALGYLSNQVGNYNEALNYYLKANIIYMEFGKKIHISENLAAISLVYGSLGNKLKSIEYQKKSLLMIDPDVDIMDASISLYNLGTTYREIEDFESAKSYILQALEKSRQINDVVGIAYAEYELSALASQQGNTELALEKVNQVLQIFKQNDLKNMVILSLLARVRHLAKLGRGVSLKDLHQAKSLIDQVQSLQRYIDYYTTLAFAYEQNNQMTLAYEALTKKQQKQQQLHKKQLENKTKKTQAAFDLKQKEYDFDLLQKDLALEKVQNAEKDSQRLILMLVLAFVISALASIAYLLRMQIRSKERFKNLALYDELTQAPNRRHIMEYARRKQDDFILFSESVVLAVLDIDFFKNVNDQFGHDVGDKVLIKFAQLLAEALRNNDKFGRIGGEEWLLVLPSTQLCKVEMIFLRLQALLAEAHFDGLPENYSITASMGASQIIEQDKNIGETLKRADEKLYQAKHDGRNCLKV